MTESEEFAQFAQTLVASTPAEAPAEAVVEAPAETPAQAEAPKAEGEQKPAAEAPKVEAKEDKPEKTDWAALAAKEKERRAQKAAARINAEKQAREVEELKQKATQLDEIMKLSKEKRLSALEKLGMTLDDVNSEYIRELDEKPNKAPAWAEQILRQQAEEKAERDAWKAEKARIEAENKAKQAEAEQAKIKNEYASRASQAIKAKPDDYDVLSRHPEGSEVVFHYIAAHYAQTATFDEAGNVIVPGEELDVHEACRRVEAGLREKLKPFASSKTLRGSVTAQDSTTLAGDMRSPASRSEPSADDDSEFKQVALRLLKQQSA
jgi:hypothetical protein